MKRSLLISLLSAFFVLLAAIPGSVNIAYAQQTEKPGETTYEQAFVPCGTKDVQKKNPTTGQMEGTDAAPQPDGVVDIPCQFTHIIVFANKLITGLIIVGVIIATMGFAYAGLLYITAMGSSEKVSRAHSIFIKTFWGFVFMLSAWLIAYTMEQIFLTTKARCNSFLTTPEDKVKLGCP